MARKNTRDQADAVTRASVAGTPADADDELRGPFRTEEHKQLTDDPDYDWLHDQAGTYMDQVRAQVRASAAGEIDGDELDRRLTRLEEKFNAEPA